ncbi:MAG: cupin domain-containing protein [Methylophilaceae bacterium]|nr:cupin domain-containing protein [Methyloradius sp.]
MKKTPETQAFNPQPLALLGNISAEQFLAEYWQKKPLLIRGAIPEFTGLLSPEELAGLACEDEVQSRLVIQQTKKWQVKHGAFDEDDFLKLPKKNWTLLVQGVNHHLPEAAELLSMFNFIPHTRLDDLMVSYAPDGGGVGPHLDSYDVFLLQGQGQRLWRISEQDDHTLVPDAPLRILQNFETQQEWLLEAGDMLYLPPKLAHWGIAVGDCMTYSIGFRAPSAAELASEFLAYLQETKTFSGLYADPDLTLQTHPAEISPSMTQKVSAILQQVKWNESDVTQFLGRYLSEPKPDVVFEQPGKISEKVFIEQLKKHGLQLSLKSQMLFHDEYFFINGEQFEFSNGTSGMLRKLADQRFISATELANIQDDTLIQQFYQWYLAGYVESKKR